MTSSKTWAASAGPRGRTGERPSRRVRAPPPRRRWRRPPAPPPLPPPQLDGDGRRVWEFLDGRPRQVDEMAQQLGLGVPELSRLLMHLEMKKVIRRLPGNQYERR